MTSRSATFTGFVTFSETLFAASAQRSVLEASMLYLLFERRLRFSVSQQIVAIEKRHFPEFLFETKKPVP